METLYIACLKIPLHILHLFELHMAIVLRHSVLVNLILNQICKLRSLTIKEDEMKTTPPPILSCSITAHRKMATTEPSGTYGRR